jgi:hypothetical protein
MAIEPYYSLVAHFNKKLSGNRHRQTDGRTETAKYIYDMYMYRYMSGDGTMEFVLTKAIRQ